MFRIDKRLVNMADSPASKENAGGGAPQKDDEADIQSAEALEMALEEAEQIRDGAMSEAQQIIDNAAAEAQQLYENAQSSGYAAGMEAGMDSARAELEAQLARDAETVRRLISEIEGERARILEGLEAEIVELTLSMVKKIINLSAETDDKIFESMIAKALKQIKPEGKATVRVSSAEYEKYFSSGGAAFSLDGEEVTIPVLPDSALGSWDCVIDTSEGTVNAGLDSQLEHMRSALDEAAAYEDD